MLLLWLQTSRAARRVARSQQQNKVRVSTDQNQRERSRIYGSTADFADGDESVCSSL